MVANSSKCASGRNSSDVKSELSEVLCVGAFCKHCDKLDIAKREVDDMLVLVMGQHFNHSFIRSAQYYWGSCSCILKSAVILANSTNTVFMRQQMWTYVAMYYSVVLSWHFINQWACPVFGLICGREIN